MVHSWQSFILESEAGISPICLKSWKLSGHLQHFFSSKLFSFVVLCEKPLIKHYTHTHANTHSQTPTTRRNPLPSSSHRYMWSTLCSCSRSSSVFLRLIHWRPILPDDIIIVAVCGCLATVRQWRNHSLSLGVSITETLRVVWIYEHHELAGCSLSLFSQK